MPSRASSYIDKVIRIDQAPIGRTPRSNPATYTGLFTPIRDLYAMLPESRERGYKPGRFSFNVKGGRCEACQGDGLKRIEMNFLPDVYVTCDVCRGRRYNRETLQVKFKGYSIADLLDATVEEALPADGEPAADPRQAADALRRGPGLRAPGAILHHALGRRGAAHQAGQGTEQAPDRAARSTCWTSPPPGLHFDDVRKLLDVLQRLVDLGNTVVVIEHNLDVIKTADWIIDLGPDGGEYGGRVVASGTPEQVSRSQEELHRRGAAQGARQREGGMSKYAERPLDFAGLKTVGLAERGGKVRTADFASAYAKGAGIAGWLDSLPHILAGDSFRAVVDALAAARGNAGARSSGGWAGTSSSAAWRRCCST